MLFGNGIIDKQPESLLNFWAIYFSSFRNSKVEEFLLILLLLQKQKSKHALFLDGKL